MSPRLAPLVPLLLASALARAGTDIGALADDGRRVLLHSDGTYDFVEAPAGKDPETSAVLSVTEVTELHSACRLEFKMQNNLGYRIDSLVPKLAVFKHPNIRYENSSVSFNAIKPTDYKLDTVQLNGIGCHESAHIQVYDASRCHMGDIDKWNEEEGQCLSHIYLEPTDLIDIAL